MKVDIAKYVAECDTCHQMKASHLKSAGVFQPLSIPMWKWDDISMDFIMGLPPTARKMHSIWVIVDRLTKTAHFIAVHTTYSVQQYAELYMDHIVRLHGIPKTIISDRGTQFVARFWEQLHECLGTKLIRSSSYHPQTDSKTERINQILEDMLRASILHFDKSWDKCLYLAEFSYNNSYQASLKMAPFDALYGRRCRAPLNWSEAGERTLFGPDLVKDAEEKVQVIRENLKMAQMRQKSYHDKGTAPRHFEVGDYVYLKVSPTKGVQRFGVKGKLAPRYIGPYAVIEVCGPVAYRIQLPERFSAVHSVFHVTQLKKGMPVPANEVITEANAWIEPDFSLMEHPLRVLDQKERKTRRQTVRMYKIQWSHQTEEEATWDTEDYLNTKYPGFLQSRNREFSPPSYFSQVESRDEIPFKGGRL
jgi:transposase InsO family protein